ncbi:glutamic-type intramembrane protease PrsW [Sutcliffiella rhizosphaerae]|uniref:Protease PrsW n=1 Tax=Sutcliffiella rhizosphaerae TaxID=2880967 RepID=A0ABM8YU73_9BACI|nr:glutamic-type intramembrane protease PrsW [Sutcliffiella rhizosphaerae]CAG9623509.1 Protease PrsW [Sutcliffiella rhizosphaerae]
MLAVVSAGIAPGLALLSYFYLKDKFEKEPISFVFKIFMFGALLVFPLMFIQYVIQLEFNVSSHFVNAFLVSGLLEEFFKWFVLIYLVYHNIHFDEHYDGIVYGVAVSLGFATAENILFLIANGVELAFGRAILPVSSHALFGVIMGYYLGKGKFSFHSKQRKKWIMLSIFIPFFLHGMYNVIILSQKYWGLYMVPFMIFLWWLGLRKVKLANTLQI